MEKKELYVAPEAEILAVSVEKGYEASFVPGGGGQGGDGAV